MKKLALNLDDLSVDSFTTATAVSARGTVDGRQVVYGPVLPSANCGGGDTSFRVTQDAACGPFTTREPGPEPSAGGTCALSVCIPLTAPNND